MSERPGPNVTLIGVSIPRSGHHFLAQLLECTLGGDIGYCEFYSEQDCCRKIPCNRWRGRSVTYQKNHDLDLAIDPHLPDVTYVVQYRAPVPAVVSDRELFAAVRGRLLADDAGRYLLFLVEKAAHYTKFYDKWIRRPGPSVFLMPYERLLDDPATVMRDLFRFCELAVSADRVANAVAKVAPVLNRPPILEETAETAFAPRVVSRSRYFDTELLPVYESLVLDRVPELAAHRVFPPVEYRDHLLYALFNIQCASLDGRLDEVVRLAQEAQTAWPDHPRAHYLAGDALQRRGEPERAVPYLETAVRLAPDAAELIVSCANAQIALRNFGRASELATQLVTLAPADSSHRLFLATILMMASRPAEALQQALHALDLGIGEPHLWRAFGHMVHEARQAGWTLRLAPPPEPDMRAS